MRKIVDNERMMLRVCDLYYNRDMSQSDIAKIMDISRPTVARLLKSAKLKRIVEITISDPQDGVILNWNRSWKRRTICRKSLLQTL